MEVPLDFNTILCGACVPLPHSSQPRALPFTRGLWLSSSTLGLQELVAIAFVEAQRNGEPDKEKKKYPGGPFDPLGFSKNPAQLKEMQLKARALRFCIACNCCWHTDSTCRTLTMFAD